MQSVVLRVLHKSRKGKMREKTSIEQSEKMGEMPLDDRHNQQQTNERVLSLHFSLSLIHLSLSIHISLNEKEREWNSFNIH